MVHLGDAVSAVLHLTVSSRVLRHHVYFLAVASHPISFSLLAHRAGDHGEPPSSTEKQLVTVPTSGELRSVFSQQQLDMCFFRIPRIILVPGRGQEG